MRLSKKPPTNEEEEEGMIWNRWVQLKKSGPWAVVVATDNIGLCASVTPKIAYAASSAPEQFESGGRFCG